MNLYFILSLDRSAGGDYLVWWGPNHCGYVEDLSRAGLYREEEAKLIISMDRGARQNAMILMEKATALSHAIMIVDLTLENLEALGTSNDELHRAAAAQ